MANENEDDEIFYLISSFIKMVYIPNTAIELIKSMREAEAGDMEMMRLLSVACGETRKIEPL